MMGAVEVTLPAGTAALSENLAAAALALARRFGAGATMWCVAPQWAWHGRHVAVEFVHPVIVGKRALPSVHVDEADPAAAVRMLSRPGDVLLAVSTADDAPTRDLLRRAAAWGLTRLWLGAGPPPPDRYADHLVWLADRDPAAAARSGDLVLLYHLLWELAHVVFEHPGLLVLELAGGPACADDVCITCSDQGDIAEVRALQPDGHAEVVVQGRSQEADVSLLDAVKPGDLVLIHAGIAISALGDEPR
jgi:hydrogenase maturation factor